MALGGDLRNINLADIFQTLSMNRQIGTLVVRNGVKEKRVYFSGGGVSLASGRTIPGFRLGRYLVGTGKVTEENLELALEEQGRSGDLLGKVLVDLDLCSTDDVETVIRYHAAEELHEIFGWDRGDFQFLEGSSSDILDRPSPFALTQFDAGTIVMEAARRIDEWERVRETIPTDSDIFIHTGVEGDDLDPEEWSADLAGVYSLVDGKLDIGQVLDKFHLSVFDTGMIVRELVLSGLIRVCEFAELTDAAWQLIEEREHESAAQILERAHGLDPRDVTVLQHLTDCYERLSEKRAAAGTLLKIGALHLEVEDTVAAIHALEKAEKYDPGGDEAPIQLMRAYQMDEDYEAYAEKARAAAMLLCEKDAYDRAIAICQQGLELAPDHLGILMVLANAHLGTGQRDLALTGLEEIAARLEEARNHRKLEEIYKKILQLDSSRTEYLERLQNLKEGNVNRRRTVLKIAVSCAAGLFLLVFSLFLVTSGTSAADRMAEANRLYAAKKYDEAHKIATEVRKDSPSSASGTDAVNLLTRIQQARATALSPKGRHEKALVEGIDIWFVPASGQFTEGSFRDGFGNLRKLAEYMKSADFEDIAKAAGKRNRTKIVEDYRKSVDSLLQTYVTLLERTISQGVNDLTTMSAVRPVDSLEKIREACEIIGDVVSRSAPEASSWEISAAELIESEIGLPDGKVTAKLRTHSANMEKLHARAAERYHTLRAVLRRHEVLTGFKKSNREVGDLLNEGNLAGARDRCRVFLAACEELLGETPLSAYEPVVEELLGDEALDLDGKMLRELDAIDEVFAGIKEAEEFVDAGMYEKANEVYRRIIGNNFRIDFGKIANLVMHLRTRPAGAEVQVTTQGNETKLLGKVPPEGLVIRYPPYGVTTIVIRKPTYEQVELRIEDFSDVGTAAPLVQLKKMPAWRFDGGGAMEATPAFRGGKVVVPSRDGHVRIFKAINGDVLADHDTKQLNGFGSTPLLLGDLIILGSLDQQLQALDLRTGESAWDYAVGKRLRCDPLLAGDTIVIVDVEGRVTAVRNGTKLWSKKLDGRVPGNPALAGNSVLVGTAEGTLYRLDAATGEILFHVSLGGRISSTPHAVAAGRIYVGTDTSKLVALSLADGAEIFRFDADNAVRGRACVVGDRVFFATLGGTVYQLLASDGSEVNHTRLPDSVSVETGVTAGTNKVYVVDTLGVLRTICPSSGVLWTFRLDGRTASAPLFHEGFLYLATEAGSVYCFKE